MSIVKLPGEFVLPLERHQERGGTGSAGFVDVVGEPLRAAFFLAGPRIIKAITPRALSAKITKIEAGRVVLPVDIMAAMEILAVVPTKTSAASNTSRIPVNVRSKAPNYERREPGKLAVFGLKGISFRFGNRSKCFYTSKGINPGIG